MLLNFSTKGVREEVKQKWAKKEMLPFFLNFSFFIPFYVYRSDWKYIYK